MDSGFGRSWESCLKVTLSSSASHRTQRTTDKVKPDKHRELDIHCAGGANAPVEGLDSRNSDNSGEAVPVGLPAIYISSSLDWGPFLGPQYSTAPF